MLAEVAREVRSGLDDQCLSLGQNQTAMSGMLGLHLHVLMIFPPLSSARMVTGFSSGVQKTNSPSTSRRIRVECGSLGCNLMVGI